MTELREKIAKTTYQYAFFIADKDIDYRWDNFGKKEEKWYYCADQILALTEAYYKEKYKDYVKLEKDQSLPSFRNAVNKSYNDYMLGQEDITKTIVRDMRMGLRKVMPMD